VRFRHLPWLALAGFLAAAFIAPPQVFAQGFLVRPMRLNAEGRAGETVVVPLEVRNSQPNRTLTIELKQVELTQAADGGWAVVEEDLDQVTPHTASALRWTRLSETQVELQPLAAANVDVTLQIPRNAVGTYVTGIIVEELSPPPTGAQFDVVLRFMVPVFVNISGRGVRQQVELVDTNLLYEPGAEGAAGRTLGTVSIDNLGRSHSALEGQLQIAALSEGRLRPVATMPIGPIGILPGVSLQLPVVLEKRLPPGTYKLEASLTVDGRRRRPLAKEVEFAGTPGATTLPIDATLELDQEFLEISAVPGSVRSATLSIRNMSPDPVQVEALTGLPQEMAREATLDSDPHVISAVEVLQVYPPKFTLRGDGRQNVRVMVRLPREADASHLYARMVFAARYADGQSAGQSETLIVVANSQGKLDASASIDGLALNEVDDNKHSLRAIVRNTGTVHQAPVVEAVIASRLGGDRIRQKMEGTDDVLLPYARQYFSATMNLAELELGRHVMKVIVSQENQLLAERQMILEISEAEDGTRSAVLTSPEAEPETPAEAETEQKVSATVSQ